MHFTFTNEQSIIADTAKGFFAEHATSKRTRAAMDGDGIDRALWQSFTRDLGLGALAIPESLGGSGLGMVELAIVAEAAGAHTAALPMLGSLAMAAQAIAAGGTDLQRKNLLPKLITGDAIAACAGSFDLTAAGNSLTGSVDFLAKAVVDRLE